MRISYEFRRVLFRSDELVLDQRRGIGGHQFDDRLHVLRDGRRIRDQAVGHHHRAEQRHEREEGVEGDAGGHQRQIVIAVHHIDALEDRAPGPPDGARDGAIRRREWLRGRSRRRPCCSSDDLGVQRPTPGAGIGCGITGAPVSARRVFNDLRLPGERKNASLVADANRDGRVERPTKQGSSVGFRAFAIWTLAGTSLLAFPAHAQITPDPTEPGQSAPATEATPATPPEGDPQANTPIVPDAAFEEALPPLSDDLDAPLEAMPARSEEQTSELQSLIRTPYAVF